MVCTPARSCSPWPLWAVANWPIGSASCGELCVSVWDARRKRLAELRLQLDSLYVTGATTVHGSPERQAVLEQLEPLLASIHALNDELEADPITTEDP